MAERKKNWYKRFIKSFGPGLFVETGNPEVGDGGETAFRLFSSTKKGDKFNLGMNENGKVSMNADVSIEILQVQRIIKGTDILIHSRNGTIDIAVNKNGAVRIRVDNVTLQASNQIKLSLVLFVWRQQMKLVCKHLKFGVVVRKVIWFLRLGCSLLHFDLT